jgi:hypothetical protein
MQYNTLCMSGGGVKGMCFVGALDYLESIHHIDMSKIKNFVGTSIGAIISYILSLDYSIQELKEFLLQFDLSKIKFQVDIINLLENHGIDNGERFILILKNFLKEKYDMEDITFEEHYTLTNNKLTVIGTNFTKSCEVVFNHINTPKMSVIKAVSISIALPIVFTPILYDSCYYIDGGLTNNFAINLCDPMTTLGLYIEYTQHHTINNILSIISGCIDLVSDIVTKRYCNEYCNIVEINNPVQENILSFEFTMENRLKLLNIGIESAKKFISNLENKKTCPKSCDKSIQTDEIPEQKL